MTAMRYHAMTNFCISDLKRPILSVTFCVIENNLQGKLSNKNVDTPRGVFLISKLKKCYLLAKSLCASRSTSVITTPPCARLVVALINSSFIEQRAAEE